MNLLSLHSSAWQPREPMHHPCWRFRRERCLLSSQQAGSACALPSWLTEQRPSTLAGSPLPDLQRPCLQPRLQGRGLTWPLVTDCSSPDAHCSTLLLCPILGPGLCPQSSDPHPQPQDSILSPGSLPRQQEELVVLEM